MEKEGSVAEREAWSLWPQVLFGQAEAQQNEPWKGKVKLESVNCLNLGRKRSLFLLGSQDSGNEWP